MAFLLMSAIVFYYLKMTFWPFTFVFIFAFLLFLILAITEKNNSLFKYFPSFFKAFWLPILLVLVFVVEFFAGSNFDNAVIVKELLLLPVPFVFFYLLIWLKCRHGKSIEILHLNTFILVSVSFVGVLGLLFEAFPSIKNAIPGILHISNGLTIANDNNFLCLFMLFGLIINNFKKVAPKFNMKYVVIFLNFLFISNIILSGSRRGIIVLFFLLVTILLMKFSTVISERNLREAMRKLAIIATYVLIMIVFVCFSIIIIPREQITEISRRYLEVLGINNPQYVDRLLWEKEIIVADKSCLIDQQYFENNLDEFVPSLAPGTSVTDVSTPFGPGKRVLREKGDEAGFSLCYNGPKILFLANHTYEISFKIKYNKGDSLSFLVGWWVDDGNRGYQNTLNLKRRFLKYDDSWFSCKAEYTFEENHAGISGYINSVKNESDFIIADFELKDMDQKPSMPRYLYEIRKVPYPQEYIDSINPPATFVEREKHIKPEPVFSDRKTRWVYAGVLWHNEYSFMNKIFGKSFIYSERYGKKFNNNVPDWPHNPFITVILYSGIAGLILYLILLFRVCQLYIIHRHKSQLAIPGFILTFFFSFFSGSDPFDPPVMGLFILIPFYINFVHNNVNSIINAKNSDNREP